MLGSGHPPTLSSLAIFDCFVALYVLWSTRTTYKPIESLYAHTRHDVHTHEHARSHRVNTHAASPTPTSAMPALPPVQPCYAALNDHNRHTCTQTQLCLHALTLRTRHPPSHQQTPASFSNSSPVISRVFQPCIQRRLQPPIDI